MIKKPFTYHTKINVIKAIGMYLYSPMFVPNVTQYPIQGLTNDTQKQYTKQLWLSQFDTIADLKLLSTNLSSILESNLLKI